MTLHISISLLGTTTRQPKQVILVRESVKDSRAGSVKQARVEMTITKVPPTTPLSRIATSSPKTTLASFAVKVIQDRKHKLIIPIIKPLTYTKWATYASMPVTEKSRKSTGSNEGTILQINENIIKNINNGLKTGTQFDKTEELVLIL